MLSLEMEEIFGRALEKHQVMPTCSKLRHKPMYKMPKHSNKNVKKLVTYRNMFFLDYGNYLQYLP